MTRLLLDTRAPAGGARHRPHPAVDRKDVRATEIPLTGVHALTAGMLRWEHRDPFDRAIVAQGMAESRTLVTVDEAVTAFPGITVLW